MAESELDREFFARPSDEVAPELLGCILEHETADGLVAVRLTEVEAYAGQLDPASHAYRGETRRTAVMFGPPGHAYVYFTYGMHFCVNIVCMPAGTASAVLLRAGEITAGAGLAARRRTAKNGNAGNTAGELKTIPAKELARGPARLCQALAITRDEDGADLCTPTSALRILPATRPAADVSEVSREEQPAISVGPRVGVSAGADTNWRYWLTNDPTVSTYRRVQPRRTNTKNPDSPG